jgi:P-type Cu2+ transporter
VPPEARFAVRVDGRARAVCCAGCEAVAAAILAQDGGDYYRLRESPAPRPRAGPAENLSVYDDPRVQSAFVRACGAAREASFLVEGIRCSACAWLNERALARAPGVLAANVDYASHRATVRWDPARASVSAILGAVAAIGYGARPYDQRGADAARAAERRDLLWRLFVAGFGMMQVMMYALPAYLAREGEMSADIAQLMRWASLALTLPVVAYSAAPFFRGAWRGLRSRRPGMDLPIALGVGVGFAASALATLRGAGEVYFDSVAMFVFLLLAGRYLELVSRERAGRALARLGRLVPELAHRLRDPPRSSEAERVPAAALRPGDFVLVKPGETFPADGVIASGSGPVSEALVSGESAPAAKAPGDAVIGGALNLASPLVVEVHATGGATVLASILRLVERAQGERPRLAQLADRAASVFVLMVLALALAAAAYWTVADPARAVAVAIAVLVATCPCALSLATPIALTVASGELARRGLVLGRGGALEALARVTDVVFDKTGTLTRGELRLAGIEILGAVPRERCLALAAGLEAASEHPIGAAIAAFARESAPAEEVRNVPGSGIEGRVEGREYRIGTLAFARGLASARAREAARDGSAWLADENGLLACFRLADELRPEARRIVAELGALGLAVHMLSGDDADACRRIAARAGIVLVRARASPEDKRRYVAALQGRGRAVAMLGDGVNDAPVLAQADVSLAMGGGTRLAQASADCVMLKADLAELPRALRLARRTLAVVRENVLWAFAYNLAVLPLAVSGALTPWAAAIGMSASSLLVVANALRLQGLRIRTPEPWTSSTFSYR